MSSIDDRMDYLRTYLGMSTELYDWNVYEVTVDNDMLSESNPFIINLNTSRRGDESEWDGKSYSFKSINDNNLTCFESPKLQFNSAGNYIVFTKYSIPGSYYITNCFSINKYQTDLSNFLEYSNIDVLAREGCWETDNIRNMDSMFEYSNVNDIDVLRYIDTSSLISMNSMFKGCSNLNFTWNMAWDTSHVTDMSQMFYGCNSLKSIDLTSINISMVRDISFMFYDCGTIETVIMPLSRTSSLKNIAHIFCNCQYLKDIRMDGIYTSGVTNMEYTFGNCRSLEVIDLHKWNTESCTCMRGMFENCTSLSSLSLDRFDTNRVTDMGNMFSGCNSMRELDIRRFKINGNIDMIFNGIAGDRSVKIICNNMDSTDVNKLIEELPVDPSVNSNIVTLPYDDIDTGSIIGKGWMHEDGRPDIDENKSELLTLAHLGRINMAIKEYMNREYSPTLHTHQDIESSLALIENYLSKADKYLASIEEYFKDK